MKRLQEFEFETHCKKLETALKRFEKKFARAYEIWGEHLRYNAENGIEKELEKDAGYCLNVFAEDGWYYFDIIILSDNQGIRGRH